MLSGPRNDTVGMLSGPRNDTVGMLSGLRNESVDELTQQHASHAVAGGTRSVRCVAWRTREQGEVTGGKLPNFSNPTNLCSVGLLVVWMVCERCVEHMAGQLRFSEVIQRLASVRGGSHRLRHLIYLGRRVLGLRGRRFWRCGRLGSRRCRLGRRHRQLGT